MTAGARARTLLVAVAGIVGVIAGSGCSAPAAVSPVRFHNRPPAWRVADRHDVPVTPMRRPVIPLFETFENAVYRRITRAFEVERTGGAGDANALDEVPDSTWFENRIGRRLLPPDEVARGPGLPGPALDGPLVITASKNEGAAAGFVVEDRTGRTFLVKLDDPKEPTLGTGTHIVVHRLLWAAGYHVPNDHLGYSMREQLVLAERAKYTDPKGRSRRMNARDLEVVLARGARGPDGSYRALFSEYLRGTPLGGFSQKGVREDDPNDTVPHEERRVLRGLSAFAGWLQHTDMREQNTLDMYVEGPRPGTHHVKHYLIDFDKALGAWTVLSRSRPADGHAELLLDRSYFLSALTLGLWKRPWEGTPESPITGIALFDAEHYDPGRWTPSVPYLPFVAADLRDMRWAVGIMLRFTPDHLRAVVRAAQFADPRAEDALTDILVARRDKTARYWLARVNPLARFTLTPRTDGRVRLCFDDLELHPRVRPELRARTRHRVTTFSDVGRQLVAGAARTPTSMTTCVPDIEPADAGADSYTIVRIETTRDGSVRAPLEVHVARDPSTRVPRIIGVWR